MWMLKVRRRLDLGQEPLGSDHRCQFRLQYLEGDLALVLQVVGQVDRSHAAFAEFTLDGVPTFEGCV